MEKPSSTRTHTVTQISLTVRDVIMITSRFYSFSRNAATIDTISVSVRYSLFCKAVHT